MKAEHWRELLDSEYDTLRMENDHCFEGEYFNAWVYNEHEDGIGPYYAFFDRAEIRAFGAAIDEKWTEHKKEFADDKGIIWRLIFKRKESIG